MLLSHEIMRSLYTSNIHFIENIETHSICLAYCILLEVAASGQHQGPHASAMVAAELVAMPPQIDTAKQTCAGKIFCLQE